MKVVLDSNVLFRTLISGGEILKIFFNPKLEIIAPIRLKEEFLNNKEEILMKSNLTSEEFDTLCSIIFERITFFKLEEYEDFISKARDLLKEHEKYEDFVALAIKNNIKLWTYEKLLFNLNIAISTKEIIERIKE